MAEPVVERLDGAAARAAVPELAALLIDVVAHGGEVSFLHPLAPDAAERFWSGVADGVACGQVVLLVTRHDGRITGTVQVQFAPQPNQPHRCDLAKMLVHSGARRGGLAAALLRAAEDAAVAAGRPLIVLDTVPGSVAAHLYEKHGFQVVGTVPRYALKTDGRTYSDTTFYWKWAGPPARA